MMQKKCWRYLLILALLLSACDSTGDEEGIEIVRYEGETVITPEVGEQRGSWGASFETSMVRLERYDESGRLEEQLSLLYAPDKELPVAANYSMWQLGEPEGTPPLNMFRGTLALQDWNVEPGGVVSGEIEGDIRRFAPMSFGLRTGTHFWAKLPE